MLICQLCNKLISLQFRDHALLHVNRKKFMIFNKGDEKEALVEATLKECFPGLEGSHVQKNHPDMLPNWNQKPVRSCAVARKGGGTLSS